MGERSGATTETPGETEKPMKHVKIGKKGLIVLLGACLFLAPALVFGQGTPRGGTQGGDEAYRLKEAEIKGELKDVMGKMRLLESEIIGSIERPRLSYSLPWKDVFLPVGPGGELEGDLLGDPYPFVDPNTFELEINRNKRDKF